MPEEIFETPQPIQPTEPKSTDWTKIVLVAIVGLGFLATSAYAGYWYGTQQVQQPEKPAPVASQPTSCGGEANICGRAMSKSDVATLPDTSLGEVLVLAIPSDKFDLLLEEVGFTKEGQNSLARLGLLQLSKELFEKYVEASAISQQNGKYALQAPFGNYLLCLANLGLPRPTEMLPAHVYGCIEATVPKNEQIIQNIFWSIGGVVPQ